MRVRDAASIKVIDHRGMAIHIDRPIGSTKTGTDPSGQPYAVTYTHDYGFLPDVMGDDSEGYDCYVGSHPASDLVHVVTQIKAGTGRYDEQKALLGFSSIEEAEQAYRAHVHPTMLGRIGTLSWRRFRLQVRKHRESGSTGPFRAETNEDVAELSDVRTIAREHGLGFGGEPSDVTPDDDAEPPSSKRPEV